MVEYNENHNNISEEQAKNKITKEIESILDKTIFGVGIEKIIYKFLDNVEEMIIYMDSFMPIVKRVEKAKLRELKKALKKERLNAFKMTYGSTDEFKDKFPGDFTLFVSSVMKLRKRLRKAQHVRQSNILLKSLFMNLFSIFDAYLGDLLRFIYDNKHDLRKSISREIQSKDIFEHNSIEDLRRMIIEKEIESLRRESYVEQFKLIENKFDISSLRKFDNWPTFVEMTQRRNLIMHNDGYVNEQYLLVCSQMNCHIDDMKVGTKLKIDDDYIFKSFKLFQEVGFKLGQTLWRKLFPDDLENADELFIDYIYNLLIEEDWHLAKIVGEYGVSLPRYFSDAKRKLMLINYIIALKFSGENEAALILLDNEDWSSACDDFKLARLVL